MKPTVSVLLVDDDAVFSHVLGVELGRLGFEVSEAHSGGEAIQAASRLEPAIVLLDLRLPDMSGLEVLRALRDKSLGSEVIMLTGHGSIDTAIESVRMGAFDYLIKPCPLDELEVRIQKALERQYLKRRATLLERGLTPPDPGGSFVGDSPAYHTMMKLIGRAAASDSTVLVTGETGSGKEMVAKLLHARGPRKSRPFVIVECASLQEGLLQSELFGHERGAFTGADRAKAGLFEVAHGGTIFLDEIGEVSHATQVKLLRVLDTSTFRRVGGTKEIRVDVRVLAATNRNLAGMVRHGTFREDLFYRLSTITIEVPPLRERDADVDILARHFVSVMNDRYGTQKRIESETLKRLRDHDWPGNVRELLHVIESCMVVCEGETILPEHLSPALRGAARRVGADPAVAGSMPTLQEMERAHIERAIREAGGHRGNAARLLGISERNLYRKLREYGLLD